MNEASKPDEFIDITGPEQESLFWNYKYWLINGQESNIQAKLDETWVHYRDVGDDRLLALVGALCIESYLDGLLQAIGPGFDQCREDTDFKFSVKIKVTRALHLIPARILTVCDLVRQVRNEFAHHLDYHEFTQLGADKYLRKFSPYVRAFNRARREPTDYRLLFKDMVGFTLAGLYGYTKQVGRLREYLETPDAREAFKQWVLKNQTRADNKQR